MRRALLPAVALSPAATKFSKASIVPGASISPMRAAIRVMVSGACRDSALMVCHQRASAGPSPKAKAATRNAVNAAVAACAPA
jgi:hypothetical protein